ncbi:MAG: hypothetical protein A2W03_05225 [Candidatus Aminicenantes bacterium RBG_16_63_16]|nr:MAG: hypothetical protein A2W03_05225 [Candidatus Aminicenantes bacterium RBG_16_63_16]
MVATAAVPGSPGSPQGTARFEQPLLITSAGQNAEVQIAAVLAKRAGLNYTLSKLAEPKDLAGMKTLVLVLGASLKGLGAAGLDMDKEDKRVDALIAEAEKNEIPVLCLHLGGEGRRGEQTDDLMAKILPQARMAIVVKSGNADGFFTKICQANKIPLVEVEKTADAQAALQQAFMK